MGTTDNDPYKPKSESSDIRELLEEIRAVRTELSGTAALAEEAKTLGQENLTRRKETRRLVKRANINSTAAVIAGLVAIIAVVVAIAVAVDADDTAEKANRAVEDASSAVEEVQKQADRDSQLVSCLVSYASDLTASLQERDTVSGTARTAQTELWRVFQRLVEHPETPNAEDIFIRAVERFRSILRRLDKTVEVNPYPDLAACLEEKGITPEEAAGTAEPAMMSAVVRGGAQCWGRSVNVRGTAGSDILFGTDGPDVIRGFRGNDLILGGAGNDYICGGRGDDTLNGGRDYDRVRGNVGNDFCLQDESSRSC